VKRQEFTGVDVRHLKSNATSDMKLYVFDEV